MGHVATLTKGQRRVLEAIARAQPPVWATSLAERMGMTRQGVHKHLRALEERGLVRVDARPRRGTVVELTDAGRRLLGLGGAPIVGEVAAGEPVFAEEKIEGYAERLEDLFPLQPGDFILRVRGDSMTGLGIFPGDYVVVRPFDGEPEPGAVVVVFLPGEETATLKRYYRKGDRVRLVSENPAYPPMEFPASEVRVQGRVLFHLGDLKHRLRQLRG